MNVTHNILITNRFPFSAAHTFVKNILSLQNYSHCFIIHHTNNINSFFNLECIYYHGLINRTIFVNVYNMGSTNLVKHAHKFSRIYIYIINIINILQ